MFALWDFHLIEFATSAVLILFCAWLNRFRGSGWLIPLPDGGGFVKTDLPGGPAVAPSFFLAGVLFAYQLTTLQVWWDLNALFLALSFATAYLLWAMLPSDWGESHDMGRSPEPNRRGFIGGLVEWFISPADQPKFDLVVWSLRNLWVFLLVPVAIISDLPLWAAPIVAFALAAFISFSYWLAMRPLWRFRDRVEPTTVAELLAGAGWGVAAVLFV